MASFGCKAGGETDDGLGRQHPCRFFARITFDVACCGLPFLPGLHSAPALCTVPLVGFHCRAALSSGLYTALPMPTSRALALLTPALLHASTRRGEYGQKPEDNGGRRQVTASGSCCSEVRYNHVSLGSARHGNERGECIRRLRCLCPY